MDCPVKTTTFLAVVATCCVLYATSEAAALASDDGKLAVGTNGNGQHQATLARQDIDDTAESDRHTTGVADDVNRLALDHEFATLIRNLVYKIEVLAEEENLRKEIQSMVHYPVEISAKDNGHAPLDGAKASVEKLVHLGLDRESAVEAQTVPAATSGPDELRQELASLQRHHKLGAAVVVDKDQNKGSV